MKLGKQSELRPRMHSRDALGLEVEQPKSEFFDPRVDFPAAELARLKELASFPVHQKKELLHDGLNLGWWLKFADPEFKRLVEHQPGFEADLKVAFNSYFILERQGSAKLKENLAWRATSVIQLFPQLRQVLRKEQFDQLLSELSDQRIQDPQLNMRRLVPLVQLYPERRTELMQAFGVSGENVITMFKEASKLFPRWGQLLVADFVANVLLLFPERRSEVVELLSDDRKKEWVSYFKQSRQPFEHYIYELGFNLTVMGAEDARIDETGQIQLHLKSRTALKAPRPLPPRPLE